MIETPLPPPGSTPSQRAHGPTVAYGVLLALLVLLAWNDLFGVGPAGPDAWPLLLQARETLADPVRLLSEPYLYGSWEGARFFRPGFVGLHAGLLAAGAGPGLFLVAALLALWVTAVLTAMTVDRLTEGRRFAGAMIAGLFVAIHPLHIDTLPALARRADLFAGALIAATVAALLASRVRPGPWRLAACVLCAGLAPLFKETGLLAAPLGLLALFLVIPRRERGRPHVVAAALLFITLASHVAWRLGVLGTIGRYDVASREVPALTRISSLFEGLAAHQGVSFSAALVSLLLVVAALATFRARVPTSGDSSRRSPFTAWIVACAWLGTTALVLAASERCRMRHAVALLPPAALVTGLWLSRVQAAPRSLARAVAASSLLAAIALALVPGSPLLSGPGPWITSAMVAERVIDAGRAVTDRALASEAVHSENVGRFVVAAAVEPDGNAGRRVLLQVAPFPYRAAAAVPGLEPRVDGAMILMPYSLEAAIRWIHPELDVSVEPRGAHWAVTPDMIEGRGS